MPRQFEDELDDTDQDYPFDIGPEGDSDRERALDDHARMVYEDYPED